MDSDGELRDFQILLRCLCTCEISALPTLEPLTVLVDESATQPKKKNLHGNWSSLVRLLVSFIVTI